MRRASTDWCMKIKITYANTYIVKIIFTNNYSELVQLPTRSCSSRSCSFTRPVCRCTLACGYKEQGDGRQSRLTRTWTDAMLRAQLFPEFHTNCERGATVHGVFALAEPIRAPFDSLWLPHWPSWMVIISRGMLVTGRTSNAATIYVRNSYTFLIRAHRITRLTIDIRPNPLTT